MTGICADCTDGFHGDCRGREQVIRGEEPCGCDCPDAAAARRAAQRRDGLPVEPRPRTLEDAHRERDAGMAQVENAADAEWLTYARAWVVEYLQAHEEWFPDDSWAAGLIEPREPRALGPIVQRLHQKGYIVPTGEHRARTRGHAATGPVWRSLIYDGRPWAAPAAP